MLERARKNEFWPKILFPCSCLLKLVRSYVQMCKRYITPLYNFLSEFFRTHVFVYGLHEIALGNKASNQRLSDWGHILPTQHPVRVPLLFNFLKIPTHLIYVCCTFSTERSVFLPKSLKINCT